MLRLFFLGALAILIGGCASVGKVENTSRTDDRSTPNYSLSTFQNKWRSDPNALMLAFSGGGTRAAALAYGVLKELRDTRVRGSIGDTRLLDEIHSISSVSGGSFTAAYYGLHGDRIFEDYEQAFLRQNVQGALIHRLLNPFRWFNRFGRTEMAVDYYEDTVFKGATFADMQQVDGPFVAINATDFARGLRFSFVQDYFDLLCSDLSSYPVARAVTASSAVPILFNPVVVENHSDCDRTKAQAWLQKARERVLDKPDLMLTVDGLDSYSDLEQRRYIHFVDGGISDNLGLRALYEVIELSGGFMQYAEKMQYTPPRRLVLISVNAATDPQSSMDQTPNQPSIAQSISAVSNVQLRRYSTDTIALVEKSLKRWAKEISSPQHPVEPYFILLDLNGIKDPDQREFLNQMPTSFSLTDEQVDALIAAGGELLRNNVEFRRLMADLAADARAGH
jgi:NTE family protein